MMRLTRLLAAIILCALSSAAAAQTWTNLSVVIDKSSSPYKVGVNIGGTIRQFYKITSGGVASPVFASGFCAANEFITASGGDPVCLRPSAANISGLSASATIDATQSANVEFTASGTGATNRAVQSKLREAMSPEDYGARAKSDTTTCSITAGQAVATCASTTEFIVGEYVSIAGAGAAFTGAVPTSPTATAGGVTGSTTWNYQVACLDANMAASAGTATFSVTNAAATLNFKTSWVDLSWTGHANCVGYAVYGGSGGVGGLLAVTKNTSLKDYGVRTTVTSHWLSQNLAGSARSGRFTAKVIAKDASTLTLDANATTTVTSRTTWHDDTAAVQAMLAAGRAQGYGRFRLNGRYNISTTLNLDFEAEIIGVASGQRLWTDQGHTFSVPENGKTAFIWHGAAGAAMIYWGKAGDADMVSGGKLAGFTLDGGGVAETNLTFADVQYYTTDQLAFVGPTYAAMAFRPTGTASTQLGGLIMSPRVNLTDFKNYVAHGVVIEALPIQGSSLTNVRIINFSGTVMAGHCFFYPGPSSAGDQFSIISPHCIRGQNATGYMMYNATLDPGAIAEGMHLVYPVSSNAVYIAKRFAQEFPLFDAVDPINFGSDFDARLHPVQGPGRSETQTKITTGVTQGIARYPNGTQNTVYADGMRWISNPSTTETRTHAGTWAVNAISSGSITAGASRFGIDLVTTATSGSGVTLSSTGAGNNYGIDPQRDNMLMVGVLLTHNTNIVARWGWADTNDLSPANGIWVEATPDVDSFYHCRSRSGGVDTVVDAYQVQPNAYEDPPTSGTKLGIAFSNLLWRIETKGSDGVDIYFQYRDTGGAAQSSWQLACTLTTNIPTVPIRNVIALNTTTTVAKRLNIWKVVEVFEDNYYHN